MMLYSESDLVYNDETHTYSLPGVGVLTSPTQVLDSMGFTPEWVKNCPRSARFGTHAHSAVRLHLFDDLDEDSLSEGIRNVLGGFKLFQLDHPEFVPMLDRVEKPSFHPQYLYAGTPDLPMQRRGKLVLFDIKTSTSQYEPSWELQTAAYEMILQYWLEIRQTFHIDRYVLWLTDKGPEYKIVPLRDTSAGSAWLNLLSIYNWKRKHGIS